MQQLADYIISVFNKYGNNPLALALPVAILLLMYRALSPGPAGWRLRLVAAAIAVFGAAAWWRM